jgi:hypothetical protein
MTTRVRAPRFEEADLLALVLEGFPEREFEVERRAAATGDHRDLRYRVHAGAPLFWTVTVVTIAAGTGTVRKVWISR